MSLLLKEDNPFSIKSYDRLRHNLSLFDLVKAIKDGDYRFVVYIVTTSSFLLNHYDPVYCALHYASAVGNDSIVHLLLCNGATPTSVSMNGYLTPLHLAIGYNHVSVARKLIAKGARMNATTQIGYTALHYGAWNEALEACKEIILAGADINFTTKFGHSPLFCAVINGSQAMVKMLIDCGADLNIASLFASNGDPAPHTLCDIRTNEEIPFTGTLMHWAMLQKDTAMLKLLEYAAYRNMYEIPTIAAFAKMRVKYEIRTRDYLSAEAGRRRKVIFKGVYRSDYESILLKHWYNIPKKIIMTNILPYLMPLTSNLPVALIRTPLVSTIEEHVTTPGGSVNSDSTQSTAGTVVGETPDDDVDTADTKDSASDSTLKTDVATPSPKRKRGRSKRTKNKVKKLSVMPPGLEGLMQPEMQKLFPDGYIPREPIKIYNRDSDVAARSEQSLLRSSHR